MHPTVDEYPEPMIGRLGISIEGFDRHNFGDLMMALASAQVAAEAYPERTIRFGATDRPVPLPPPTTLRRFIKYLSGGRLGTRLPPYRLSREALGDPACKLLLYCNGYLFGGHWPPAMFLSVAEDFERARRLGKRLILMPQSFGPFHESWQRDAMRRVLDASDLVFTRDEQSYSYLGEIGKPGDKIQLAADYTPLLGSSQEVVPPKNRLTVVPNIKIGERFGEHALKTYVNVLIHLQRKITAATGAIPVVLSHTADKDRSIIDALLCAGFSLQDHIKDPLSAREFIGASRFVISSRFHALVSALSQARPAICIGWTHKYTELMQQYGVSALVCAWDAPDAVNFAELIVASEADFAAELKRRAAGIRLRVGRQLRDGLSGSEPISKN